MKEKITLHFYLRSKKAVAIILSRYDIFISKRITTHITTNLSATEIETCYGARVRSRTREMINLISYEKKHKRQTLIIKNLQYEINYFILGLDPLQ